MAVPLKISTARLQVYMYVHTIRVQNDKSHIMCLVFSVLMYLAFAYLTFIPKNILKMQPFWISF